MLALSSIELLIIYIPTILFLIIFLVELLAGFRRGLRKSIILFINMVIAMGVTLIVYFIFFGKNFDEKLVEYYNVIRGWFGFDSLGKLFNTSEHIQLSAYLLDYFVDNVDIVISDTASLAATIQLVMALAESIVRTIVFSLMGIIYYLTKFILYIIYLIFFKEKRYKKKITKSFLAGTQTKEYKPRHLWGMALGAFRGLVVGVFIFSFIGSFFHIFTNGEYSRGSDNDDTIVSDNYYINGVVQMVNRYGKTGIGQVLEAIGTKKNGPWYLLIADGISAVDYSVEIDDEEVSGKLIARKELGPILSLIKDGYILFNEYDVDFSKINDPLYLSEILKKEIDGISLADELDKLIDKHNFGQYTINLCQSFLNAVMTNLPDNVSADENSDLAAKILNCVFKGENAVKASSLITNESITNALELTVTVLANYQDINDFIAQLNQANQKEEALVFGFKPLTEETKKTYQGVSDTLIAIGEYIEKLDCVKDGLISDIVIAILDSIEFDGVERIDSTTNEEYIKSCSLVKWKNNLSDICNTMADFVGHITEYGIYNTDDLLNDIIDNLDNENSESRKLVDKLLDADFSGVILNNPNVVNMISHTISDSTDGLIKLNTKVKLGSYYDENKKLQNGDLNNIIKNFISETKTIYNIVKTNEGDTRNMVKEIFSVDTITNKLPNIVDTNSDVYSITLHSIISSALININQVMGDSLGFRIIIEEKYVTDDMIDSEALTNALSMVTEYIPVFLDESFDYKTGITTKMVNDLANTSLLKASIAEVIYYALSQIEQISDYIPASYVLGNGNDNNLSGWIDDNGELDSLLKMINAGANSQSGKSLLNTLLNYSNDTDIIDEILSFDYDTLTEIENALVASNVINCIMTGFIEDISISNVKIKIPNLCISYVSTKKKINSDLNIFSILKQTNLYDVIKSSDALNSAVDFLFSTDLLDLIFNNRIINSIVVQMLDSFENSKVKIIIPNSSYTAEALKADDKIIKTSEFVTAINDLKLLFEKNDDGKYDISKINYNKIFDISLNDTDIIGATIASILMNNAKDPIKIPKRLSDVYLENDYITSGWKNEVQNVIDGLRAFNINFEDDGSTKIYVNEVVQSFNAVADGETKTNLERMYSSDILKLTVYNAITGLSTNAIKIPEDAVDILDSNEADTYIVYDEIKCLADAVEQLNISDVENFEVKTIFKDKEKLSSLSNILVKSTILRYTTTIYLQKDEDAIYIPDIAYDSMTKSRMITRDEAQGLVNVIEICGDLDSFDFNCLFEDAAEDIISLVNGSTIIRSTLTNNLRKNNDNIKIPESAYDLEAALAGNEAKASSRNTLLSEEEIEGLVGTIKALEINTTSDFDFDNVFSLDKDKLFTYLEKSTVLRYTISSKLGGTTIKVPMAAYDSSIEVNDCFIDESSERLYQRIILTSELDALYDAVAKCGKTTNNFDFNKLLGNGSIATSINASLILRYTVSDKLINDTSAILIPDEATEDLSSSLDIEEIAIKKEEITALFDGVNALGLNNTGDFNFNSFLSQTGLADIINASLILRYTVTDTICKTDALVVTNSAIDSNMTSLMLKEDELTALVRAVNEMGIANLDDTNVTIANVSSKIDIILASNILQTTISTEMYKNDCKLDSMYNDIVKLLDSDEDYYVMKADYIKDYIVKITDILGGDATYGAKIELDTDTASKIQKMASSRIILLTNSQDIISYVNNHFGAFIDMNDYIELVDNVVSYITDGFVVASENIITNIDSLVNSLNQF